MLLVIEHAIDDRGPCEMRAAPCDFEFARAVSEEYLWSAFCKDHMWKFHSPMNPIC